MEARMCFEFQHGLADISNFYPSPLALDKILSLRTMSHTIYAAKFEQMIIHQHVHLRRESQSHAHVLMRLYPIDKSLICLQSERRTYY
jgi:hypothetical protein